MNSFHPKAGRVETVAALQSAHNGPGNKEKDKDGKEQNKSKTLPKGVELHLRHLNSE